MSVAALVLIGAGVGVGMAVTAGASSPPSGTMNMGTASPGAASSGTASSGTKSKHGGKHHGKDQKNKGMQAQQVDPARQAWAHKYGVDRSTMPNLAPTASATSQQKAAATALLVQTEAATAKYANLATAKAAGFDLQASLARSEKKHSGLAAELQRIDAGQQPKSGMPPMLHVGNVANRADGKVLDPNAPETLMYEYTGHRSWKLIGVMYTANESYPQAPPDPGGPITRWHYHDKSGGQRLMMHIFFVAGNDLAHAYAAEMT